MPTKLEVTMPSEREICITRTFDAPPGLVFECHTKSELVKKWLLGPPGWSMPLCEIDLRPADATITCGAMIARVRSSACRDSSARFLRPIGS